MDFATYTLSVLPGADGTGARIVAGSVASRPLRAKKAEEMLNSGQGDAECIAREAARELRIVSFVRGGVEFKRQIIEAGLKRALIQQGLNSRPGGRFVR